MCAVFRPAGTALNNQSAAWQALCLYYTPKHSVQSNTLQRWQLSAELRPTVKATHYTAYLGYCAFTVHTMHCCHDIAGYRPPYTTNTPL